MTIEHPQNERAAHIGRPVRPAIVTSSDLGDDELTLARKPSPDHAPMALDAGLTGWPDRLA